MAAPRKWRQLLELLAGLKIPLNAALGKVLTSDAEGNASWAYPGELNVAMAYRNAAQKIPNATTTRVKLDKVIKDPGGNINVAEGFYTAPADGYYSISGQTEVELAKGFCVCNILVNGTVRLRGNVVNVASEGSSASVAAGIVFLKSGEKIELAAYHEAGGERNLVLEEANNRLSVTRVGEGPKGEKGANGEGLGLSAVAPALIYRSAAQKVKVEEIKVELDTALFDPSAAFSAANHCYTAPATGYYQVSAQVELEDATAAVEEFGCLVTVNGGERLRGSRSTTGTTAPLDGRIAATAAGLVKLTAGDKVELWVDQRNTAKTEHNLAVGSTTNFLSVSRVA